MFASDVPPLLLADFPEAMAQHYPPTTAGYRVPIPHLLVIEPRPSYTI